MDIVIEGPDNSGKTTLVNFIAPRLGLTVVKGEGPPLGPEEWVERFAREPESYTIFDRHTAVSEPIYGRILRGVSYADAYPELIERFYQRPHLFIYCRGDASLDDHQADHERDTPEHIAALNENHQLICDAYDAWAINHAHIIRRKFDDLHHCLAMVRACVTRYMTRRGPYRFNMGVSP